MLIFAHAVVTGIRGIECTVSLVSLCFVSIVGQLVFFAFVGRKSRQTQTENDTTGELSLAYVVRIRHLSI